MITILIIASIVGALLLWALCIAAGRADDLYAAMTQPQHDPSGDGIETLGFARGAWVDHGEGR